MCFMFVCISSCMICICVCMICICICIICICAICIFVNFRGKSYSCGKSLRPRHMSGRAMLSEIQKSLTNKKISHKYKNLSQTRKALFAFLSLLTSLCLSGQLLDKAGGKFPMLRNESATSVWKIINVILIPRIRYKFVERFNLKGLNSSQIGWGCSALSILHTNYSQHNHHHYHLYHHRHHHNHHRHHHHHHDRHHHDHHDRHNAQEKIFNLRGSITVCPCVRQRAPEMFLPLLIKKKTLFLPNFQRTFQKLCQLH